MMLHKFRVTQFQGFYQTSRVVLDLGNKETGVEDNKEEEVTRTRKHKRKSTRNVPR